MGRQDLTGVKGDDGDLLLVADGQDAPAGVGRTDLEVVEAAGPAQGDGALAVGGVVPEAEVARGAAPGGMGLGPRGVRALMAAGLVDFVQVTLFPVITGQTGTNLIFHGTADFDLELIGHRTFDGHTHELIYRPTLH